MNRIRCTVWLSLLLNACGSHSDESPNAPIPTPPPGMPSCVLDGDAIEIGGGVGSADAKTYREFPFFVPPQTGRIEVAYGWSEKSGLPATRFTATTFDLGLWDEHGYRNADPFVDEFEIEREATSEGPLGTFWRIETRDSQTRTTIGNPIFLREPQS